MHKKTLVVLISEINETTKTFKTELPAKFSEERRKRSEFSKSSRRNVLLLLLSSSPSLYMLIYL
jgi:hypothetical protein